MLSFSVRPGRTAFRNPVTYRSSDPSRVRMVYLGRSFDEVTAPPEDNIAIEALTDSGEATITITAPGFTTKNIAVKLYPGAFVPPTHHRRRFPWAGPIQVYALYRPVDPATGSPIGPMACRSAPE
ncbi:MAG: hypothetical protein IPP47_33070 [Bryobacterales bacterium]|nr:hypothetical protein [Bryobacterales bacterium]